MPWNSELFRQAGLRTRHVATYVPVTRETVSSWLNDRHEPAKQLTEQLQALQDAVEAAIEDGLLPITNRPDLSQAERDLRIHRVLLDYLQRGEDAQLTIE
jgi:hypothetical protein